jgi:hypothetical protein
LFVPDFVISVQVMERGGSPVGKKKHLQSYHGQNFVSSVNDSEGN